MKEIFKKIDQSLQKAKDRKSESVHAEAKSFYRGQISAYIEVGLLLQEFITQQVTEADPQKCSICGSLDAGHHEWDCKYYGCSPPY